MDVDLDYLDRADAVRLRGRFLELEPGHLAFLEALDDGEIRPETPPLDGIHDRVRANPALRWRLQTGAKPSKSADLR